MQITALIDFHKDKAYWTLSETFQRLSAYRDFVHPAVLDPVGGPFERHTHGRVSRQAVEEEEPRVESHNRLLRYSLV